MLIFHGHLTFFTATFEQSGRHLRQGPERFCDRRSDRRCAPGVRPLVDRGSDHWFHNMLHDYEPAFLGGVGVRGGWWAVIGCCKMEDCFYWLNFFC